jgi:hypothetical protein
VVRSPDLGQAESVRILLVVLLAAAAAALPASAASVDPQVLVLAETDVPPGFRLSSSDSGLRTNEREAKQYPETREIFKRWHRITGYQVVYRRGDSNVLGRADVFRGADGASKLVGRIDLELRRMGIPGLKRSRAMIGRESWVHWTRSVGGYTVVVWRHGRVAATMLGLRVTKAQTLTLARAQQRRIAGAIR